MKYFIPFLFLFTFIACQETINEPPQGYELEQNFPNPFNDTTVITYGIPSSTFGPRIRLVVNDRFNQTVAILVSTYNHPAGRFRIVWNGCGTNLEKCPAGIYYIELQQVESTGSDDVLIRLRKAALKQ